MQRTAAQVRQQFPAIGDDFIFLDHAGGSQVPRCVMDRIRRFMEEDYVQLGGDYPHSLRAQATKDEAHRWLNVLFNGEGLGNAAIGSSSTALVFLLATSFSKTIQPGDEIVISMANHEANIGPWMRLESHGATIVPWSVDPETGLSDLQQLRHLVTDRTRLVAFAQTSNLLGDVLDPREVANIAHAVGACVVCDCVAAAPHQAMDVSAWDVDFCFFSNYKVFGPHCAAMWGKTSAWTALDGPNHYFIPRDSNAGAFELGSLPYELLAGVNALQDYFRFLVDEEGPCGRDTVEQAFAVIRSLEIPVQSRLIDYLLSRSDVRLFGPQSGDESRLPIVGFTVQGKSSASVASALCVQNIGVKHGHFYAQRLCSELGLDPEDGIVRLSAVHTNTVAEIDRVIECLEAL